MGISSNGQICYGIAFGEEYNFPWLDEKWDNDHEAWWFDGVCGYKSPCDIYNSDGEYISGERPSQEKVDQYYEHSRQFRFENPIPVVIESYCSYDYPMYIIAVKDTITSASRGEAIKLSIDNIDPEKEKAVIDFCETYCKPMNEYDEFPEMKLNWLLSSMFG